jgi:hypothetical protein
MKTPPRIKSVVSALVVGWLLALPARSMVINIAYDSSVTSSPNSLQIQTAFNAAAIYIQNLFTNNITVNIDVYWGPFGPFAGGVGFGSSNTEFVGTFTYAALTNALRNARTTAADSNAVASLPASDPIATNLWWLPRAEAKALGLGVAANDPNVDGSVGFGTNYNFTFDPGNRAVAGKYDFIAVAEHEITEVLGRVYFDLSTTFIPYDLFRFTNNGARSFNINSSGVYFSVDNGATAMRYFNPNAGVGDVTDWALNGASDCCDYQIGSGRKPVLSFADMTALDVIGYNLSYTPPHLAGQKSGTNFVLTFTNTPGSAYTLLATTNLSQSISNWATLGILTDSVPGQFQFTDTQAVTNKNRFYRAKLN